MPIYEYKCTICDERFEVEQSIKAKTLTKIKGEDHDHKVKKVFHAPGIAFKGEGFYKNDSRGKKSSSSSTTSSSSSDTTSASSSSSSSSSTSDTSSSSSSTTSSAATSD